MNTLSKEFSKADWWYITMATYEAVYTEDGIISTCSPVTGDWKVMYVGDVQSVKNWMEEMNDRYEYESEFAE